MKFNIELFQKKLQILALSKKTVVLMATLFFVFTAIFGISYGRFVYVVDDPSRLLNESFISFRQEVLKKSILNKSDVNVVFFERTTYTNQTSVISDSLKEYYFITVNEQNDSDLFSLSSYVEFSQNNINYRLDGNMFFGYGFIDETYPLVYDFSYIVNGNESSDIYQLRAFSDFEGDAIFGDSTKIPSDFLPLVQEHARKMIDAFRTDGFTCFDDYGIEDVPAFLTTLRLELISVQTSIMLTFLASIVSAILGTVFLSLLSAVALQYAAYKKHIAVNEMNAITSYFKSEEEDLPATKEGPIDAPKDGMDGRVARLMYRWKWKPCIHEIAIRAVGIGVLVLCGIFFALQALGTRYGWEGAWLTFSSAMETPVQSFSSLGNFILIITVVTIISESHKDILRNSMIFLTLGLLYYVFVTLAFALVLRVLSGSLLGFFFELAFQYSLPGNVPMGVGIFWFVGLFLFSDPDPHFINRKAFRALVVIPVLFALLSTIFSYLSKAQIFHVHYAISNLFFIRDPSFLFIGISFEFVIFGLRSRYRKIYGNRYHEIERLPQIQMVKNLALVGLVILFNIIFFFIPSFVRTSLGFTSVYCIYFLAIPLFLFQKPSREKRKALWDVIYYIFFFIATMLPGIISSLNTFFGG